MRAKMQLAGSTNQRVTEKLAMPGLPLSNMPLEWLDAGSWRLPSGKALAEFALQAGFLAPQLFKAQRFGGESRAVITESSMLGRSNQFGKSGDR